MMSNQNSHNVDEAISQPAHALTSDDVVRELHSDGISGLSQDEAVTRLAQFGRNDFGEDRKVQPLQILFSQVLNVMVLVSNDDYAVFCSVDALLTNNSGPNPGLCRKFCHKSLGRRCSTIGLDPHRYRDWILPRPSSSQDHSIT